MSLNTLVLIVAVLAICTANVVIGRRWSRLDHNPWARSPSDPRIAVDPYAGDPYAGDPDADKEPAPGWNPGAMDVATIRQRGRQLMIAAPIASVIFLVVVMVSSSRF